MTDDEIIAVAVNSLNSKQPNEFTYEEVLKTISLIRQAERKKILGLIDTKLKEIKEIKVWDEWEDGVIFGKEDTLEWIKEALKKEVEKK